VQRGVVVTVHPRRVRLGPDRRLQVQVVIVAFHQILREPIFCLIFSAERDSIKNSSFNINSSALLFRNNAIYTKVFAVFDLIQYV
jgi:hypothetical protein